MYGKGTRRKTRHFWNMLIKGHVGGRNRATDPVRRPRKKNWQLISIAG